MVIALPLGAVIGHTGKVHRAGVRAGQRAAGAAHPGPADHAGAVGPAPLKGNVALLGPGDRGAGHPGDPADPVEHLRRHRHRRPGRRDAAKGMGMTGRQVLTRVELPVALPLIMSGIRSAYLQVVATATIAAVISLGGFGRYVLDGLCPAELLDDGRPAPSWWRCWRSSATGSSRSSRTSWSHRAHRSQRAGQGHHRRFGRARRPPRSVAADDRPTALTFDVAPACASTRTTTDRPLDRHRPPITTPSTTPPDQPQLQPAPPDRRPTPTQGVPVSVRSSLTRGSTLVAAGLAAALALTACGSSSDPLASSSAPRQPPPRQLPGSGSAAAGGTDRHRLRRTSRRAP